MQSQQERGLAESHCSDWTVKILALKAAANDEYNLQNDNKDDFTDKVKTCSAEHFRCGSGLCIPRSWQCDGEKDCPELEALDEWDLLCGNNG